MTRSQIKRIILAALRQWRPITDTDRWEINLLWQDSPQSADGAIMGVVVQPQYESADFYVNIDLILAGKHTARSLSYDVLHELCHLHTAMLARLAEQRQSDDRVGDANELATKKMASAVWRAYFREEPPA